MRLKKTSFASLFDGTYNKINLDKCGVENK